MIMWVDMRRWLALAAALLVATGSGTWAGPPTDQLHGRIDRVLKVLGEPALKNDAQTTERRATLRGIADEIFDFTEISQRSLGRHWQGRTPSERAEFVALFADLLERTYISKIESYSGERVVYAGETLDGDQATVRTRRRASLLPAGKTFDAREPERSVIPQATQQALRTLEWIDRAEVLCVCGPSGTGKSRDGGVAGFRKASNAKNPGRAPSNCSPGPRKLRFKSTLFSLTLRSHAIP